MPYLIGTDEAGYSPNLGPLVISATLWHVADATECVDLYRHLRLVVCRTPGRGPHKKLAIADSKALYSPASGLSLLERGVLAALGLAGNCPGNWQEAWQTLDPRTAESLQRMPWHAGYQLRLPVAADAEDVLQLVAQVRPALARRGVRLLGVFSRAVFPDEFNQSNRDLGNKSYTLSRITLNLLAQALELCVGEPTWVVCDKHGGRNYYGPLLQQQFPDPLIEVHGETTAESIYRWGPPAARIEVRFRVGGESFLPAALASMASKYLRELSMRAFNDFWCTRVENLAPTAGYPRDARRFRAAIEPTQRQLGIDDHILWRER